MATKKQGTPIMNIWSQYLEYVHQNYICHLLPIWLSNFPFSEEFINAFQEEVNADYDRLKFNSASEVIPLFEGLVSMVGQKFYGDDWTQKRVQLFDKQPQTAHKVHYLPAEHIQKYTIRISLKGIMPTIWRKLEVPSNITMASLADILIYAMGWRNTHLNQFTDKRIHYKELTEDDMLWDCTDEDDPFFQDRPRWMFLTRESSKYTLSQVLPEKGKKIEFEYDFGDSWCHNLSVSAIDEYAEGEEHKVHLLSGKNACPPDDCYGIYGYNALRQYFYTGKKDPTFPDMFYAGVDECFNPAFYSVDAFREMIEILN